MLNRLHHLITLTSLVFALSHSTLFAADGSSGCGPAWYILKDNSLLSSAGRYVTNGVLTPLVTLGMIFGTSNCKRHSLVMKEKAVELYVGHHLEQLRVEGARGQGMKLVAVGGMLGCSSRGISELGRVIKNKYRAVYSKNNASEILNNVRKQIEMSPYLLKQCQLPYSYEA